MCDALEWFSVHDSFRVRCIVRCHHLNKREWPEGVCTARVTSSRSLRAHTKSGESIRKICGSEATIHHRAIFDSSTEFVFSACAEGRADNLHTSFKYRDENSEGTSSLTVRTNLRLHACGSKSLQGICLSYYHSIIKCTV